MQKITFVDATGLHCPLPVLKTKKALAGVGPGDIVRVSSTDPESERDFPAFAARHGHRLICWEQSGNQLLFTIEKGRTAARAANGASGEV